MEPSIILSAVSLAVFIEALVSYVFQPIKSRRDLLRYLTLVLGVLAAINFGVDFFTAFTSKLPFVTMIMTGTVLGRGSNYVYAWFGKKPEPAVSVSTGDVAHQTNVATVAPTPEA